MSTFGSLPPPRFFATFFSAGMVKSSGVKETFLIRNTLRALPVTAPAPPPPDQAPPERPQPRQQDGGGARELVRDPARPGGWRGQRDVRVWDMRRFASGASARGLVRRTPLLSSVLRGRAEQAGVLPDLQAACGRVRASLCLRSFRGDGEQHGGAVPD